MQATAQSEDFRTYLEIRDRVLRMLKQEEAQYHRPSRYWEEELANFDYLLDASPSIVNKLRHHCYHLTGLRVYDYRTNQRSRKQAFVSKLRMLTAVDHSALLVPESRILGGFGYEIDGELYNLDTLKFYECLIALDHAGILSEFRARGTPRKLVWEIGGGWGGFAFQFKRLCPNVTYIIMDFPQVFLFSAVYLKTAYPEAQILMYDDGTPPDAPEEWGEVDFVFVPHTHLDRMRSLSVDLTINQVSFQEMTTEQVDAYVRTARDLGCPHFYSLNRDRSPYNDQLTSTRDIISEYYDVSEVKVLDIPYTSLPTLGGQLDSASRFIRKVAQKIVDRPQGHSENVYRHLVGALT